MPDMTLRQVLDQAMAHQRAGRLPQAEKIYRHVLSQHPQEPNSLHLLGAIAYEQGRLEEARELMQRAVTIDPNSAVIHGNLAQVLARMERNDEALAEFSRALELNPNQPDVLCNLGDLLRICGRVTEALTHLQRAAAYSPNNANIQNNLGNAQRDAGDFHGAIASLRRAVDLGGDLPVFHNNLGNALMDAGKLDEAIAEFNRAMELDPNYAPAHNNLGSTLRLMGRFEQALECYQRAVQTGPNIAMHHFNLGLAHLVLGQFEPGWRENEWRWRVREHRLRDRFSQPLWDGSDLQGRRILLYTEQGFGDAIMFARYAPMVAQRGGKVVLACHPELTQLFQTLDEAEQIVPINGPIPDVQVRCPLLTLPMLFKTDLSSIPAPIPYLKAIEEASSRWQARVKEASGKINIGLAWAGRPTYRFDHHRSISLSILEPITRNTDVRLFSLQKDRPLDGLNAVDWTSELTDFAETAALIENLDLVISVDTAVAHLAGAMGKPVWMLLPYIPDWRWMLDRTDSPWYPTMRLFRQPGPFDWNTPIGQMTEALGQFARR